MEWGHGALERRRKDAFAVRDRWLPIWKDLGNYVLPQYSRALYPGNDRKPRRGDENMVTSIPTLAARVMGSGLQSGMTSKARQWWRAGVSDPDKGKFPKHRIWLDEVTDRLTSMFAQGNFYQAVHHVWATAPTFGTGATMWQSDFNSVARGIPLNLGEYALINDSVGRTVGIYREFSLTVWAIVDKFGKENCPKKIVDAYARNDTESLHKIIHAIEPNDDRIPQSNLNKDLPYRSVYYLEGTSPYEEPLEVSGYEEKPFAVFHYETAGIDPYGFGPGWMVLPDCKELHAMTRDRGVGIEKSVNPPLQAHVSDEGRVVNAAPGGLSFYSQMQGGNSGKISPLYEVSPDLGGITLGINELREIVDQAYFKDLFLAIMFRSGGSAEKTAKEIVSIEQEKLLMLTPAVERGSEFLDDIINRWFGIAYRGGAIPPPPPGLMDEVIGIEYVSILAQAQKMMDVAKIEQGAAFVAQAATLYPEVTDILDPDEMGDIYLTALQIPQRMLRDRDVREKIRVDRARMIQEQQSMEAMNQMAQQGKTLSETDLSGQNALGALLGGMGRP